MQTTKFIKKETVAEGTMLFHFEKPQGFTYQAGQTIDLTLINPSETDEEGTSRTFSLTSAPEDADLEITTRMRDTAFKRVLGKMEPGADITVDGPFGSFLLHENVSRPAVFLAGGIGITPFHSIIKDATARALPHKIILFYSNRRPEDTAFLEELLDTEKKNPNFKLVATMTDMEKSAQAWTGERGYITADLIKKYVPEGELPVYYLAGPPVMVVAMRDMLKAAGVSGDDIRFEDFAGY